MHGKGVMIWTDGRKYEGELYYGKIHGYGIFTWPDGKRYEGQFVKGKKHGYGIHEWGDGRRYKNGERQVGIWLCGKLDN